MGGAMACLLSIAKHAICEKTGEDKPSPLPYSDRYENVYYF
jgi:hypothetical protein